MLTSHYLMTETWQRQADRWKLQMVHAYAILKDPPAITLPAKDLQQYAGRYSGGADLAYLIQWDGKQLLGGRPGRSMTPLQVEVRDVLSRRRTSPQSQDLSADAMPTARSQGSSIVARAKGSVWHRESSGGS